MGSILEPPGPERSGASPTAETGGTTRAAHHSFEDRRRALETQKEAQERRAKEMDRILEQRREEVAKKQKLFDQSLPGFIIENAAAMRDLRRLRWPKGVILPSEAGNRYKDLIEAEKSYGVFLRERQDAEKQAREARQKLNSLPQNER